MSRRGPYAKTEARRADILHQALEAFSTSGFQGTSLREIAEAVGLSQAGVLHHFSSKEALLAAVLAEKDAATLETFPSDGTGVLAALRSVVASNMNQPALIRLYCTLSAEAINEAHPAHEYFQLRYDAARELIASALTAGQASGEVRQDLDVEVAGSVLLAVMDGLQLQWLLNDQFDMLAGFDAFLATFRATVSVG